jgi:hypothetical protein
MSTRSIAHDRTFADAELWARDYCAGELHHRKTFNALTLEQQAEVIKMMHIGTMAIQMYMTGMCEPMNDYIREKVQLGATVTPTETASPVSWFQGFSRPSVLRVQ